MLPFSIMFSTRSGAAVFDRDLHEVCEAIASALQEVGRVLWTAGYLIGTDRRDGASRFEFGKGMA